MGVKMPDFLGLVSKLFSNEPLERLMFMIIIFALAVIFTPDHIQHVINDKIGIPYSYQIVMFAASFVLAINMQRAFFFARNFLRERKEAKRKKGLYEYVNQVIDSFNEEQMELMRVALSRQYPMIHAQRNDKNIAELVKYKVLSPMDGQMLPHEAPMSMLQVTDIFWNVMMSRWNGYSGEIE
ncbi:superinfection exclusion B family protein [Citrobacter braakii]|uniref:Superinfection exclusion B family protein n=1 Tax=Citrobacter braakii TaxID=57706 RepID=A0ABR6TZM3_CITBR|nr:super-infection exclusion protein B [Citrobacter braakii]MBC2612350.1 superinfection exclusion B family protein [Citrobacter braakii]MBC2636322.1 superinfection exclusion B family protein [Citrobacter braakii]MBC2649041.1 superinfection exclusion B family protein [Citrobacter braakii]